MYCSSSIVIVYNVILLEIYVHHESHVVHFYLQVFAITSNSPMDKDLS